MTDQQPKTSSAEQQYASREISLCIRQLQLEASKAKAAVDAYQFLLHGLFGRIDLAEGHLKVDFSEMQETMEWLNTRCQFLEDDAKGLADDTDTVAVRFLDAEYESELKPATQNVQPPTSALQ